MKPSSKQISIFLIVLLMLISTLFLVEGKVETDKPYKLSLVAKLRFSTVTLTAHLTLTEEHHERGHAFYEEENVAGALIHFYTCNSHGDHRKEVGHSITGHDGTATFCWSAPGNGNYWFIAGYILSTEHGEKCGEMMVTS